MLTSALLQVQTQLSEPLTLTFEAQKAKSFCAQFAESIDSGDNKERGLKRQINVRVRESIQQLCPQCDVDPHSDHYTSNQHTSKCV